MGTALISCSGLRNDLVSRLCVPMRRYAVYKVTVGNLIGSPYCFVCQALLVVENGMVEYEVQVPKEDTDIISESLLFLQSPRPENDVSLSVSSL